MSRLTLKYMRTQTRLPRVLGLCFDNIPEIAEAINASQTRLIYAPESGDEGWLGTWARMRFNVYQSNPYLSLGRYGARLMDVSVCRKAVAINNEFAEFMIFGNGLMPKFDCSGNVQGCAGIGAVLDRGFYPTFRDLSGTGRLIRVRALDTLDAAGNYRTLIQGTDIADVNISSQDGSQRVSGIYLNIVSPFVDTPMTVNSITGIQKDVTNGQIQYWEVDPATAQETLILTMEPGETTANYRRYYLHGLPTNCCPPIKDAGGNLMVQVQALVKLNFIPVAVDPDYLLLQNSEAIISECQSARYSTMDITQAKSMAASSHKDAINLLNGELTHHYGLNKPAVSFMPFGSARLERQGVGTLI